MEVRIEACGHGCALDRKNLTTVRGRWRKTECFKKEAVEPGKQRVGVCQLRPPRSPCRVHRCGELALLLRLRKDDNDSAHFIRIEFSTRRLIAPSVDLLVADVVR